MTQAPLDAVPDSVRARVARLAAETIEHAALFGDGRWGLTPTWMAFD